MMSDIVEEKRVALDGVTVIEREHEEEEEVDALSPLPAARAGMAAPGRLVKSGTLVLLRGLPGAGKSTLGHALTSACYSADDYFLDADGRYNFDPSQLQQAHKSCIAHVADAMMRSEALIAVANTFCAAWEMAPYLDLAEAYGYRVHAAVVENRHRSDSIHGVPAEVIARMRRRFGLVL